jgi:hypothetical protein
MITSTDYCASCGTHTGDCELHEFNVLGMRVQYLICATCQKVQGREEIEYRLAQEWIDRT